MIVVLKGGSSQDQVAEVLREMERLGMQGRVMGADGKALIHVIDGPTRRARRLLQFDRVQALIPTSGPRIRMYGRRFYPYHFLGWCAGFLLLVGILVFLSGMFPPGLGAPVDVRTPPVELGLPWYLALPGGFLSAFPAGWSAFAWPALFLVLLVFFFLPLLDRTTGHTWRRRVLVVGPGLVVIAVLMFLCLRGVAG